MKKLIFIIMFFGVFHASGTTDTPIIYIEMSNPIIKPPEKAEIQYKLFTQHLGLIESNNNLIAVNQIGMMGKYQFSCSTLDYLGYKGITPEKFRDNPGIFPEYLQEEALRDLIRFNERCLKKFTSYIGTVVNGVRITKAGLIAASHLAGAGGVQHYLTNNHNATDMNGASIQSYLAEFQNFTI
jgi:hypothetical protein